MLIAGIVVVAVFIAFIVTTYLITRKTYTFELDGRKIKFANAGSTCKIFVDDKLIETYHMPQLISGTTFNIKVDKKDVVIKCKSNSYGNKLSMVALVGDKEVYNNGVKVK